MSQRIKVLHLIPSLGVGGAEQLLLHLAPRLDPRQFEVHICSLGEALGNGLRPEFERIDVPMLIIDSKHMYSLRILRDVMSYVRNRHIDIIHTHQSNADVIGLLAGRILGRPVISTMHSIPENYRYERLHSRWLTRLTARYLASRFIAVSQSVRTRFIAQWHIPADQITTIYNTVPIEPYLWIPDGVCRHADGDGLVITNIGRLGTSKGQHILLEATSLVLRARPDARLMIVGHGRLEQQLKQHARDLGIFERVTFTGMRRDIPAVLAQSDIFVLSSLWEGLPLTAVEAMAAARPVVLSDVGGCRELIEPGVQGLIVPPGDAQALADALLSLANDRERRLAMGRAGRARVRQEFCMGIFVAQHEMLYRSIWKESHVAGHQGKHASLV